MYIIYVYNPILTYTQKASLANIVRIFRDHKNINDIVKSNSRLIKPLKTSVTIHWMECNVIIRNTRQNLCETTRPSILRFA